MYATQHSVAERALKMLQQIKNKSEEYIFDEFIFYFSMLKQPKHELMITNTVTKIITDKSSLARQRFCRSGWFNLANYKNQKKKKNSLIKF